jgi:hypothetical protein
MAKVEIGEIRTGTPRCLGMLRKIVIRIDSLALSSEPCNDRNPEGVTFE